MTYGFKLASLTLVAYLIEGAVGLPVFAKGGGIAYLTGPTLAEGPKQMPLRVAYDPAWKQTQLKWVISL